MRRLVILAALLFTLLAVWPQAALADGGIEVVSSRAEARFPTAVTFYLQAEAPADIVDIDIVYRVSASTLVPVSCRAAVDFEEGQSVAASWQWDMLQSGGLPPGTEVEYWWVLSDATGQR